LNRSHDPFVTDRYLGHARGVAFVEMASAGDADKAITELNGTQLHAGQNTPGWGGKGRERPQKRQTLITMRQLSAANN
jgi:RNA recognition motif-containing protein